MPVTTRAGKGAPLTSVEMDANLSGLQSDIAGKAPLSHQHSGADLTTGTVPIARLGASGTRDSGTYLAGDNTWKPIPAAGVTTTAGITDFTPAVQALIAGSITEGATQAVTASFGAYDGNSVTDSDAFDAWLGRNADLRVAFFNQTSWINFENSIDYMVNLFNSRRCIWSVPLAAAYGTVPDVVAGTHDAKFTRCAQAILSKQPGNHPILIRPGWEFNLLSQEQRAFDGAAPPNPIPSTWVSAFRRIVFLFRAVSSRFRFIWCSNIGDATENGLTVESCYPGDDVVDFIGMDLYFNTAFGDVTTDAGAGTFGYRKTQGAGLDWSVAFAAAHGKPWCVPEWGIQSNLATSYMTSFCQYLVDKGCFFHCYWDDPGAIDCKISNGNLPAIGAIYKKYFGRPVVTTPATSNSAQNVNYTVALTSNQDSIYTVTWEVVSGPATISGNTLTITGAPAGARTVVVRPKSSHATLGAGGLYGNSFTITHTFMTAYTFTDTDAAAWIAARPTASSETLKAAADQLVIALKSAGTWTKAAEIYLAVDTAAASNIGMKLSKVRTNFNSPVFTPYEGFQTAYDATNPRYSRLGVAGQAQAPASLNSIWIMAWERGDAADNAPALGLPGSNSQLNGRNASNLAVGQPNDWSALTTASSDARGIWSAIRSGASARRLRKNGTTVASDTAGSGQADTANEWMEGGNDYGAPGPHQLRAILIGSAPTDAEEAATVTALQNFYSALGAAA